MEDEGESLQESEVLGDYMQTVHHRTNRTDKTDRTKTDMKYKAITACSELHKLKVDLQQQQQ